MLLVLAAAAGGVVWTIGRRPALPEVEARREGDLVYLTAAGGLTSSGLPLVGLEAPAPPRRSVDRAQLQAPRAAHMLGAQGPVFVAFLDYRCTWCRRHAPNLLAQAERGRLRLVVRDWPILGPASTLGARAALAAGLQGAYWPFHEALMTSAFLPTEALVEELSSREGLDTERLLRDQGSPEVDAALAYNAELARGIGAHGTPTYVVEGVVMAGGYEIDTLLALGDRYRLR